MIQKRAFSIIVICPFLLLIGLLLSLKFGSVDLSLHDVRHAFFHYSKDDLNDLIIMTTRLPRAVGAIAIGALLAISGAVMQGVTRNYLASPSILGVTDGSVLFVTVGTVFFALSSVELMLVSFIGSILAMVIVFGIAGIIPNGFQPVRLAILGVVMGTLFSSIASGLSIYHGEAQNISFWYNTRLDSIEMADLQLAAPFMIAGLVIALYLAKSITILALGEENAVGLGVNKTWIKTLALVSVGLMTGSSIAIAGSIAFIGLVIPHITRFIVGSDYRWIIPCSGLLGGIFLCYADIGSRLVNKPYEMPVTIIVTAICIPFFVYLIYKKGGKQSV